MTNFIVLPRGGGKTTALVERMLADASLYYMAPTRQMAKIAFRQARQHYPSIDSNRFIAATAMYRPALKDKRILVDEVGGVLNSLLGGAQVMAVTGTDHADNHRASEAAYTAAERGFLADPALVAALEKANTSTERVERPRHKKED